MSIGKLVGVHEAGLVAKKYKNFIKSLMDGVASCKRDDGTKLLRPIEMKTRTELSTIEAAQKIAEDVSGAEYVAGRPVYGACSATNLAAWIPKLD